MSECLASAFRTMGEIRWDRVSFHSVQLCLLSSKLFPVYNCSSHHSSNGSIKKVLSKEQMYRMALSLHIRAVRRTSDV